MSSAASGLRGSLRANFMAALFIRRAPSKKFYCCPNAIISVGPDVDERMPYSAREQRGWYMYDWANSAFASTVVTLFLGPYLTALAKAAAGADGRVHPLGIPVD